MSGKETPATAVLTSQRVAHTLHPYQTSADTGRQGRGRRSGPADRPGLGQGADYGRAVAEELAVPPERVFKTLVAEVDGALTVAVVPVAGDLDLKALAAAIGAKRAVLADRDVAERATGYVRGGISPLGQRKRLPTVVDSSATGFDTVYVSAGRRGLQVELAPADLVQLTGATLAKIAR